MNRHENSNQFKDGLLMDLHPLQTPNTVLTDNLNGTFITYNGNEYSLQNDMGNFKLRNCRLKPGYLPIGTTSYADTIYILSYNPIKNNIELGSYPSPVKYSTSEDWDELQIRSVVENYIVNNFDNLQQNINNGDRIKIKQSDAQNYASTVVFDKRNSKLKRGDEYTFEIVGVAACEFEEFEYSVILDSGKTQKIIPNTTIKTQPVSWDTPGNIQIKNKLYEIEQQSCRIVSKHTFKNTVEIGILFEMFITDKSFIQKLDSGKISINGNENAIKINSKANYTLNKKSYNSSGEIKNIELTSWLGDCRKIECLLKFVIDSEKQNDKIIFPEKINFEIFAEFYSNLVIKQEETPSPILVSLIQDSEKIEFDLDDLKIDEIGNSEFYWDEDHITVNYSVIEDYIPYYKIEVGNENAEWNELTGDIKINNKWKNKFVVISFCYKEKVENPTQLTGDDDNWIAVYYDERENKWINWEEGREESEKKYYNKLEYSLESGKFLKKSQENNITRKVIFLYTNTDSKGNLRMSKLWEEYRQKILSDSNPDNDGLSYSTRYDLIPFVDIYKEHLSELQFGNPSVTMKDFGILHDAGAEEGEFYNYFKRFSDNTIPCPSIVDVAPKSYKSDQCFEVPIGITINCDIEGNVGNLGDIKTDDIKNNIDIVYNDRKDLNGREVTSQKYNSKITFEHSSETPLIRIWNKIQCSVQQKGDAFYYHDKLKYYQMSDVNNDDNDFKFRFDAVTLDQDGGGNDRVECEIEGQDFSWRALDIQNYRAIRMAFNGAEEDETLGCRQMDFSGYDEAGIEMVDDLTNISSGILGGTVGGGIIADLAAGVTPVTATVIASVVALGAVSVSIAALSHLKSFNKRKLSGMCNYIGNFHTKIRNVLDNSWTEPKIKNSNPQECESQKVHGLTRCIATTFYRDKNQRPSFTNKSSLDIFPNWKKWKKEATGGSSYSTRHNSKEQTFITFPVCCIGDTYTNNPIWNGQLATTTMQKSNDTELWVKVSSSEQHSTPDLNTGETKFNGIGFVTSKNEGNPGWYIAWIPDWETSEDSEKKFKLCTQTQIEYNNSWISKDNLSPNWCGSLILRTRIPNDIIKKCKTIIEKYPSSDFSILPKGDELIEIDNTDIWSNWKNPDSYFENLQQRCYDDYESLKEHPIYKSFINAGSGVSDRIKNWPASGIYPNIQNDLSGDFFDSANKDTLPWRNIYVNSKGRPFLTNLDPENNIYVCKNSKKEVFGYFPYVHLH